MSTDIDPRFGQVDLRGVQPAGEVSEYREAAARVRQRQEAGLPPAGAVQMTTTPPASAPRLLLPSVARRLAGHRIDDLRGQAAKIEQGLSRGPIGASGVQDPYLVQVHRQAREQLQAVQEEIERLSQMDDNEVREWAANERPRRARGF